jgi:hypothetical protein
VFSHRLLPRTGGVDVVVMVNRNHLFTINQTDGSSMHRFFEGFRFQGRDTYLSR